MVPGLGGLAHMSVSGPCQLALIQRVVSCPQAGRHWMFGVAGRASETGGRSVAWLSIVLSRRVSWWVAEGLGSGILLTPRAPWACRSARYLGAVLS